MALPSFGRAISGWTLVRLSDKFLRRRPPLAGADGQRGRVLDEDADRRRQLIGSVRPISAAGRLSDRVVALLRGWIDGGALRPGDRLPTEHELTAATGVSRAVVREAVARLKTDGLVI
ncbi:MAG: winged helix-turn-helix transcriptional regulator, partial [Rhodobacteraceae bacterium]|nr:winged helix-turn-helix transcriptional regulator [Paracoccaceae bacterium]